MKRPVQILEEICIFLQKRHSGNCPDVTLYVFKFYIIVSVHHKSIIYNKPTRCNSGSIVFINNYKYALSVVVNKHNTARVASCWLIIYYIIITLHVITHIYVNEFFNKA